MDFKTHIKEKYNYEFQSMVGEYVQNIEYPRFIGYDFKGKGKVTLKYYNESHLGTSHYSYFLAYNEQGKLDFCVSQYIQMYNDTYIESDYLSVLIPDVNQLLLKVRMKNLEDGSDTEVLRAALFDCGDCIKNYCFCEFKTYEFENKKFIAWKGDQLVLLENNELHAYDIDLGDYNGVYSNGIAIEHRGRIYLRQQEKLPMTEYPSVLKLKREN